MKMILLGAPGAGKGTQAERLCKVLNIPTISTGNILRAAVKNGTPTGKQAEAYMKAGKLVPDEVIIGIIHDRLDEDDCKNGYILDGVPRTIAQAESLEKAGIRFDDVISIEIPDEAIMEPPRLRALRSQLPSGGCASQGARRVRQLRRQADSASR